MRVGGHPDFQRRIKVSEKELIEQRLEKIQGLREQGIGPYAYKYNRTHNNRDVSQKYAELSGETFSEEKVAVAGRVVAYRGHGKTVFGHVLDESGKLQVYFRANDLPEEKFQLVKQLDVGDFIGVQGSVFRTRTGELTVKVEDVELLAKAVRPMPEKWHGLKDVEVRYRQRYLDLLSNETSMETFRTRFEIIREIRNYLQERGFMEVETPMMQPIPGGAAAKPFMTHHNALSRDLFMRIAPELYLKRLLIGGFEKVFELNRNFRNEGISTMHNPEFTMIEIYQAYVDGEAMMQLTESMIAHLAQSIHGTTKITYQDTAIDLTPPWRRLGYVEAVNEAVGRNTWEENEEALAALCREHKLEIPEHAKKMEMIELLFEELVEPALIQPTFVVDFPIELSPLAKQKANAPHLADRFEPYIAGHEYANGFSELNDPLEQRRRFEAQLKKRERGDDEAQRMDEDYLRAMEYGMPPAGGLGIGIDRLVMLLTDSASIRDVILFPQLRQMVSLPQHDEETE